MTSFRTGFKIFGEISLKQGLGRIRSFSEDRKPGQWLPEDQWAVRQPGTTCPETCGEKSKPVKPSKSWLSICKDPAESPPTCDIRHNNCPPPPAPKEGAPWYSLDNLLPKKKADKLPPLRTCKKEMKRKELLEEEDEVCPELDKSFAVTNKPDLSESCMSKVEPSPAPVITLSTPLPKEVDIMLWCGKPSLSTLRVAASCQSDKLPYQEFRPQKSWKPPPFSLPCKKDFSNFQSCSTTTQAAFSEFKQVEVPKPLYTRYKSVDLSDKDFLFSMIDVTCPPEGSSALTVSPSAPPVSSLTAASAATASPPCPPESSPPKNDSNDSEQNQKKEFYDEKPLVKAASREPVRIKKATKFTFRPKPTKLIEKKVFKNPCALHKKCNLNLRAPEETEKNDFCTKEKPKKVAERAKVITGTLTNEPRMFERNFIVTSTPPKWMYVLCKPGCKDSPLLPKNDEFPKEPTDWAAETDGLKFYDGNDGCITPKPKPNLSIACNNRPKTPCKSSEVAPKSVSTTEQNKSTPPAKNEFVLMPESYNIKFSKRPEPKLQDFKREKEKDTNKNKDKNKEKDSDKSFENFIQSKLPPINPKSYPPMKENILYDLQRLCPNVPLDPSKIIPTRKPPELECPQPPRFYRSFSTLSASKLRSLKTFQLLKTQRRTECGDSSLKCKKPKLVPKPKDCPKNRKLPDCASLTLPCCPKARIPPTCFSSPPMPPCKKKLPPKPSFSECSKDPPPCPKITECNCWDRKNGNGSSKH